MFVSYPRKRESLYLLVHFGGENDPQCKFRFSPEECARAIALSRTIAPQVGRIEGGEAHHELRNTTTYPVHHARETSWLFHKLMAAAVEANDRYWQFDITGFFQGLQLLSYKADTRQHYTWHMDIGPGPDTGRKISISVQLSDPGDYEGGELEINTGKTIAAPREKGTVVLFPSFVMHRVAPVTRGERWSLVGWVQGQDHFR